MKQQDEGGPAASCGTEREGIAHGAYCMRSVRAMLDALQYSPQMIPNGLETQLLGLRL